MHHHLEIIMPPTNDIEAAVKQIMQPFDEGFSDEEGHSYDHAFWDWYVIGGRYSNQKLECAFDPEKKKAFDAELEKLKVTVSRFRAGKPELSPARQIPIVDALWNKYFPDSPAKVCPFFMHLNDQYKNNTGFPDVMQLKDTPSSLTANQVIIANLCWGDEPKLRAAYMTQESFWNGVSWVKAAWNGNVLAAIDEYMENPNHLESEELTKRTPQADWLAVTVDYHS